MAESDECCRNEEITCHLIHPRISLRCKEIGDTAGSAAVRHGMGLSFICAVYLFRDF